MVYTQDKPAEGSVKKNVVYAMYSGLALLLDVYHPAKANGYAIIYINGSGYQAPLGYSNFSIKDFPISPAGVKPLLDAGYTAFAINHRAAPQFRYPAAQEDAQRAVRFVRYHAKKFGIRPDHIGATGSSSGGHLALMLGVLEGTGVPDDTDPVGRESARVQCVVTKAAPCDLINAFDPTKGNATLIYLGVGPNRSPSSQEYKMYRESSPITHVTRDATPCLLIHGDADEVVPFKHAELMEAALKKAGVPVKLLRMKGQGHGTGPKDGIDPAEERVKWFDQYLKGK
jgi:acetyl esterase/lipase